MPVQAGRVRVDDSPAPIFVDVNRATRKQLVEGLQVSAKLADTLVAARRRRPMTGAAGVAAVKGIDAARARALAHRIAFAGEESFHITDIPQAGRGIFSGRPFALRVGFHDPEGAVVFAAATVHWAGDPFSDGEDG